ncbi:MAG: NUDIX domain-containing protein [Treponema sp.]|nr:NUDIX domain-containing protein [Treponema sp.]
MVDKVQMIGTAFLPVDRVNKKILVSKRSMNKKYFPGFWEVLGGNLEFGEDFKDCVIREVKEEINCEIKGLEHLHSRVMYLNDLMYITATYYGELCDEPVFNKDEISEIIWISEDELGDFEFCPGDVELLKLGFEKI